MVPCLLIAAKLLKRLSVGKEYNFSISIQVQLEKMYATMVYKDKKLLDLNNKLLDTDKVIMDLQETIHEKDEVIKGRDKAIKVWPSCLMYFTYLLTWKKKLCWRNDEKRAKLQFQLLLVKQALLTS